MKRKTFSFPCYDGQCLKLADIIRHYSHAAFPPGGSDCAQAARESLLSLAQNIEHCTEEYTVINIRQRRVLMSAINWYFAEVECDENTQRTMLTALGRS